MVVPFVVQSNHCIQVGDHAGLVTIHEEASPGAVGHVVREVSVISAVEHVVDVVVAETPVTQPSPFADVKACRIVERSPRLQLPAHIVEEFYSLVSFV